MKKSLISKSCFISLSAVFIFVFFPFPTRAFSEPAQATPVLANVQTYDQLLSAIHEVQAASQKRVEQAVDAEKVREAWETGKLIDEHILQHKERADYGERVLERLGGDLGTSETELRFMLKFFRTYPIPPTSEELTWSHYREILSLDQKEARSKVADEALRQKWSVQQVRAQVRRRQVGSKSQDEKLPVSAPGNLYTFRVVKPSEGPYSGQLALDLGFAVTFRPREFDLNSFKEGDVVALRDGKLTQVNGELVGTYQAYVTEVIDGDTVHARIDLGFGITIHQKLRLRGLDAPPLESSDGREAKEFLEKHGVRPGARILVKTTKSDKYDRYLADVWTEEKYLNQQLIDEGLAVRMSE